MRAFTHIDDTHIGPTKSSLVRMAVLCLGFVSACGAARSFESSAPGTVMIEVEDAGTPDAGDGACEVIDFTNATVVRAKYSNAIFGASGNMVELRTTSGASVTIDLWYRGLNLHPTFPWPVQLWPTTRAECETCVTLRRGAITSIANGGLITFDSATRDWTTGRFTGNASLINLVDWNSLEDEALRGGRCVELRNVSFDATWDLTDAGP